MSKLSQASCLSQMFALSDYAPQMNMCAQVSHKSTQRQVNIIVRKNQRGWWDRLTVQERKPLFLAPDFDRWLEESDAEMEFQQRVSFTTAGCFSAQNPHSLIYS